MEEEPEMDMTLDFDQVTLFPAQQELPMQMAVAESRKKSE